MSESYTYCVPSSSHSTKIPNYREICPKKVAIEFAQCMWTIPWNLVRVGSVTGAQDRDFGGQGLLENRIDALKPCDGCSYDLAVHNLQAEESGEIFLVRHGMQSVDEMAERKREEICGSIESREMSLNRVL
ncbi:hypothetical protein Tco_0169756 [Tanacetum coccineum]